MTLMHNWTLDCPIKTQEVCISGNEDDVSSATWKNMQNSGYIWHSSDISSIHSWSVFSPSSQRKGGDRGEFIHMPWISFSRNMYWSLPQFKAGFWVVKWECRTFKATGNVGGVRVVAGILELQAMQKVQWFMNCTIVSYSKIVHYNLEHTIFLQTQ